jgi:Arc/MetJ-type ribon-helix-helix transcriptional regulator
MAITTIKSTYSLDVQTVRILERIARRWNVSKSEALRRAIRSAAGSPLPIDDRLQALDQLQRSLRLSPAKRRRWVETARTERRASSSRAESRDR